MAPKSKRAPHHQPIVQIDSSSGGSDGEGDGGANTNIPSSSAGSHRHHHDPHADDGGVAAVASSSSLPNVSTPNNANCGSSASAPAVDSVLSGDDASSSSSGGGGVGLLPPVRSPIVGDFAATTVSPLTNNSSSSDPQQQQCLPEAFVTRGRSGCSSTAKPKQIGLEQSLGGAHASSSPASSGVGGGIVGGVIASGSAMLSSVPSHISSLRSSVEDGLAATRHGLSVATTQSAAFVTSTVERTTQRTVETAVWTKEKVLEFIFAILRFFAISVAVIGGLLFVFSALLAVSASYGAFWASAAHWWFLRDAPSAVDLPVDFDADPLTSESWRWGALEDDALDSLQKTVERIDAMLGRDRRGQNGMNPKPSAASAADSDGVAEGVVIGTAGATTASSGSSSSNAALSTLNTAIVDIATRSHVDAAAIRRSFIKRQWESIVGVATVPLLHTGEGGGGGSGANSNGFCAAAPASGANKNNGEYDDDDEDYEDSLLFTTTCAASPPLFPSLKPSNGFSLVAGRAYDVSLSFHTEVSCTVERGIVDGIQRVSLAKRRLAEARAQQGFLSRFVFGPVGAGGWESTVREEDVFSSFSSLSQPSPHSFSSFGIAGAAQQHVSVPLGIDTTLFGKSKRRVTAEHSTHKKKASHPASIVSLTSTKSSAVLDVDLLDVITQKGRGADVADVKGRHTVGWAGSSFTEIFFPFLSPSFSLFDSLRFWITLPLTIASYCLATAVDWALYSASVAMNVLMWVCFGWARVLVFAGRSVLDFVWTGEAASVGGLFGAGGADASGSSSSPPTSSSPFVLLSYRLPQPTLISIAEAFVPTALLLERVQGMNITVQRRVSLASSMLASLSALSGPSIPSAPSMTFSTSAPQGTYYASSSSIGDGSAAVHATAASPRVTDVLITKASLRFTPLFSGLQYYFYHHPLVCFAVISAVNGVMCFGFGLVALLAAVGLLYVAYFDDGTNTTTTNTNNGGGRGPQQQQRRVASNSSNNSAGVRRGGVGGVRVGSGGGSSAPIRSHGHPSGPLGDASGGMHRRQRQWDGSAE